MNLSSYSHLIFDFDETIATLQIRWPEWHRQIASVIQNYEADFNAEDAVKLTMYDIHRYINRYGKAFRDDFVAFEQRIETQNYHGFDIVPAGFALLKQAQQEQKQLYLLTSNCRAVVGPVLIELGIKDYFQRIITVDDVANLKPSAMPWQLIAATEAEQQIPKAKWLMVGDSASDSGFAATVGINFVNVNELTH